MNLEKARFNMIEQQIRPWDVLAADVLDLLMVVKREAFVPPAYRSMAFVDAEIPLPGGENMLQPKFEARILQELAVKKHEQVLEIGAGSGYQAALLAYKARHVTTVDISPELTDMARANLAAYGVDNVDVQQGDGARGWPAPAAGGSGNSAVQAYDVIVVSGSMPILPQALMQQLKIGGRMFVVTGSAPAMAAQLVTRMSDIGFDTVKLFETVIKPLRNAVTPSHFVF
ncbi:MAG: protein-L-isoaspartate O-methyltransferase [Herminiimonas sp.]|nr:protein-L-isoaspartate O-methyltransferase [Herminiimonas sp.]